MSISIIDHPFTIDFVKNDMSFTFQGNPIVDAGAKYVTVFSFTRWTRVVGETFTFYYGEYHEKSVTYTTVATEAEARENANAIPIISAVFNTFHMKNFLQEFFVNNYELNKYFNITVWNETINGVVYCFLKFETKEPTSQESAVEFSRDGEFMISRYSEILGRDAVVKNNYSVFVQIEIDRYVNSVLETVQTEPLYLSINDKGRTMLPLTILRNYFENIDVPTVTEGFSLYPLQHIYLRYRLRYAECYGDIPSVQYITTTEDYFAVNGVLNRANSKLNYPDWITIDPTVPISTCTKPRVYGEDDGCTVKITDGSNSFLYICCFREESFYLSIKTTLRTLRNSIISETGMGVAPGNQFYRLPVGFTELFPSVPISNCLCYDIELSYFVDSERKEVFFTKQFIIVPHSYFSKEFFLHDRYGCLHSFLIANEKIEKDVEGDEILLEGGRYVNVTDASKVYVARTGFKTKKEMQLLSDAKESQYNFKKNGVKLYRITILPDTLVIFDEANDLQSAEFSYKYTIIGEDIETNAPVNITEGTLGGSVLNCSEQNVWMDDEQINKLEAFNELINSSANNEREEL